MIANVVFFRFVLSSYTPEAGRLCGVVFSDALAQLDSHRAHLDTVVPLLQPPKVEQGPNSGATEAPTVAGVLSPTSWLSWSQFSPVKS